MTITPQSAYGTAQYIVSATPGQGNYTTIQEAINAASSGQTIFIRPGTYTENLTLKAGLSINAYGGDALTPTVLIVGNHTYTGIGACTFSNIQFQTNSGYIGTVSGSSASVLTFTNCWFNITNNNGFLLSSSSALSQINLFNCFGDITNTGITIANVTGAGVFSARNTRITNSGNSTTASTCSSSTTGLIVATDCTFGTPFVSSGNGSLEFFYCRLALLNTTAITTSGTSSICQLYWCTLITGTASAVSIGTGTAAEVDHCIISSSNTNAITGLGTLIYGVVTFNGSSSGINTSTLVPLTTLPSAGGGGGNLILIQSQTFSAQSTVSFTAGLTTYNNLFVVFSNITTSPAGGGNLLQMQVSTDGGSTYVSSGYVSGLNILSALTGAIINDNASTSFILAGGSIVTAGGTFYIHDLTSGADIKIQGNTALYNSGGPLLYQELVVGVVTTANANAIQFSDQGAGTISGTISVYGILE